MPTFAPLGRSSTSLMDFENRAKGSRLIGLERGELVALAFDLGVEVGLVLEVVGVDVTVGQGLVRQGVVRVLGDFEIETGILSEILVDEAQDVALRHRSGADRELGDVAVLLADGVGSAADEAAAREQQGRTRSDGDELGLHGSPCVSVSLV